VVVPLKKKKVRLQMMNTWIVWRQRKLRLGQQRQMVLLLRMHLAMLLTVL
jgi:hypothetical protein